MNFAPDPVSRKSVNGYGFKLAPLDNHLQKSISSYRTSRQRMVATSTAESETRSICAAVKQVVYLRRLIEEIFLKNNLTILLLNDNTSALECCTHPTKHNATKHFDVDTKFTRQHVELQTVQLRYIPSKENLADTLTKPLAKLEFEEQR